MYKGLRTRMNRVTYGLCLGLFVAIYAVLIAFAKRPPAVAEIVLLYICVPRLHDIGLSGWWYGAGILSEIAVVVASIILLPLSEALVPIGFFVLFLLFVLVWLGLIPGEPGSNRFGERPAPGFSFGKTAQPASTDLRAFD